MAANVYTISMISIRRLSRHEKPVAVDILARAFFNYQVMRYVLKDAADQFSERHQALIAFFCETRLSRDWPLLGLFDNDRLLAVAGVNEPKDKPWPPSLEKIYRELGELIGPAAMERLENFEKFSANLEPPPPYYFLGIIGVDPDCQGGGYGTTLIRHVQQMSLDNPISTGVCLSTESADNVPFYENLGFEILGEADIEELHTWCLFWKNRS